VQQHSTAGRELGKPINYVCVLKCAYLDSPFDVQQHIQALIHSQHRQVEAIVKLHELFGSCGEGRVHLDFGAIA